MSFRPLPTTACWEHLEARSGFEVSYFQALADGCVVDGTTAAVEDGQTWVVTYHIRLDASWVTRSARVASRSLGGQQRYDYAAPVFGFTDRLVYDESGLVLEYPGIARRVAVLNVP